MSANKTPPLMSRWWAMPNGDTFKMPPVRALLTKYVSGVTVDPFARNAKEAQYTNDLNVGTSAEYHLDSVEFLEKLEAMGVVADTVLFDPPYSPRQMKELYDGIGLKMGQNGAHRCASWKNERDIIARLVRVGGLVLSFGWNTLGQGEGRGFEPLEVVVITHGAAHNDTLCLVERRIK